jgi:hypothetical protein
MCSYDCSRASLITRSATALWNWKLTARTIEVLSRGMRAAAHVRASSNRGHTTVRERMPSSHRRYAGWTPGRLRRQAGEIGGHTSTLVEIILRERTHPEQGFRACILRLARATCQDRLEAACSRALEIGARSYSSVNSILKNNLDRSGSLADASGHEAPTLIRLMVRGEARRCGTDVPPGSWSSVVSGGLLDHARADLDQHSRMVVELSLRAAQWAE